MGILVCKLSGQKRVEQNNGFIKVPNKYSINGIFKII